MRLLKKDLYPKQKSLRKIFWLADYSVTVLVNSELISYVLQGTGSE